MVPASVIATRVAVLRTLLERYEEFVDPLTTNGEKGNGDQPPQMPGTYTRSVRELERLLGRLRDADRFIWWHLTEKYLRSTTTIWEGWEKRRLPSGRTVSEPVRKITHHVNPRVIEVFVEDGIEWLAREWGLRSEPMLPRGGKDAKFPWDKDQAKKPAEDGS